MLLKEIRSLGKLGMPLAEISDKSLVLTDNLSGLVGYLTKMVRLALENRQLAFDRLIEVAVPCPPTSLTNIFSKLSGCGMNGATATLSHIDGSLTTGAIFFSKWKRPPLHF